jgi:hypothetical protein
VTAKQRHRAGTFDRWRGDDGMVRCHLRSEECRGRLQACHYLSCQDLRIQQSRVRLGTRMELAGKYDDRYSPEQLHLRDTDLDDLYADDRNSLVLCSHFHHPAFDGLTIRRLSIPPPPAVVEFAIEFGLEHLLPTTTEEAV